MGRHGTAIIDYTAEIDPTAHIGPYCIIGARVKIGPRTRVLAHAVIGGPPESRMHWNNWDYGVEIGADCFIGNAVTIDSGTRRNTRIGDGCILLRHSHVGHDAVIEQDVVLSCNVLIGGHTHVMRGANCGLGSIVHQNHLVGSYAMLGAGTIVPKKRDIVPGNTYVGNPAELLKVNAVGLKMHGVTNEVLAEEIELWKELKRK